MASFSPARNVQDDAVEMLAAGGGVAQITIQGESMLPTLRPGQRVAVDFAARSPRRGELALFRQQDYHVVHRILGPASNPPEAGCLRARGDRLPGLDPPVAPSAIRGTVIATEASADRWWSLRGGGARRYALAVALHALFWGGLAALAARAGAPALRRLVSRCDRALLGFAHRAFFPLCHRQGEPPRANDGVR
jgi:hypothetical protein